jgi:ABC-type nitrate/sulfonate/bicarbonate transport system permease component
LVGVRFALGLVWVLLIVAETISAQSGIGYMTMNARAGAALPLLCCEPGCSTGCCMFEAGCAR